MQTTMTAAGNGHIIADWSTLADYITADEAAEIAGYHVNYIRRLMRAQKIKGRKAGLVWLIERDSLQAYMERIQALGAQKFTPDRYKDPE
jgi:excisionase family DNA binding protein